MGEQIITTPEQLTPIIESIIRNYMLPLVREEAARLVGNEIIPTIKQEAEGISRQVAERITYDILARAVGKQFVVEIKEKGSP